jgi:ATP-binding cassette subfamily F protein 3
VVVVSHDRSLLRGACDRFVLVASGSVRPFDGDLEDYAAWLNTNEGALSPKDAAPASLSRRDERRAAAQARARLSSLRGEQAELEARIGALNAERAGLETTLANPATYATRGKAEQRQLSQRHGELNAEILRLEERWLNVCAMLEEQAS